MVIADTVCQALMLNALCSQYNSSFHPHNNLYRGTIIPILHRKKLMLREIKKVSRPHSGGTIRQTTGSDPVSVLSHN